MMRPNHNNKAIIAKMLSSWQVSLAQLASLSSCSFSVTYLHLSAIVCVGVERTVSALAGGRYDTDSLTMEIFVLVD